MINISEKWFRRDWESHVALEHWLSGRVFQLTVTQPEIAAILSRVLRKEIQYELVGTVRQGMSSSSPFPISSKTSMMSLSPGAVF
jgi:hypothetical protein